MLQAVMLDEAKVPMVPSVVIMPPARDNDPIVMAVRSYVMDAADAGEAPSRAMHAMRLNNFVFMM
ncbi:MAG: hypothetical protein WBG15_05920 [Xanthobacteraceae bacterium]